jgi:hypothetical protein
MLSTRKLTAMALGIMLGGAALAFAAPPGATIYRGYLDTRNVLGPRQFTLRVDGFVDDAALRDAELTLVNSGQEAMFAALWKMKPSGWLQLDRDTGYPVAVVAQRRVAGGVEVTAVLDRPVSFREFWNGTLSRDYPFGLVVIHLDDTGKGSGTLVPAARAKVAKDGTMTFSDYERVPYRILRVRTDVQHDS